MTVASGAPLASTARPIALRRRADLVSRRHRYRHRTLWVIKDPIALRYFELEDPDYFVLQSLDGAVSLDQLRESYDRRFAPLTIEPRELQQSIAKLHELGLVIANGTQQGRTYLNRRFKERRKKLAALLLNPMSIRWKGVDPDRWLTFLLPLVSWYFSRPMVALVVVATIASALAMGTRYQEVMERLPEFQAFFGPENWFYLGLSAAIAKVLHEFGHGFVCKRTGGECHEMGIMLLVFTPALYCNTSDSWLAPSKWTRMAVGLAGIYVEAAIFTLATIAWFNSDEGLVHHMALNLMFVCGVSTIMFNGNPLMRFDGYFVFADWMEVPNLRQRATIEANELLKRLALGFDGPRQYEAKFRERLGLVTFAIASVIYKWFVVAGILLVIHAVLAPYGLGAVGKGLGLIGLITLVAQPAWQTAKFFHDPANRTQIKRRRFSITLIVLAIVVGVLTLLPLPARVVCPATLENRDAATAFVSYSGQLTSLLVKPGEQVEAGQIIAVLENSDLELEIKRLEGEVDAIEQELELLERRRFSESSVASEIVVKRESLESARQHVEDQKAIRERLVIRAPIGGTVLPVPPASESMENEEQLPNWTGSLFDPENRDAWLESGTPICQIGQPNDLSLILWVEQQDLEFVRRGQPVAVQWLSRPQQQFLSSVGTLSDRPVESIPVAVTKNLWSTIPTEPTSEGALRPIPAVYRVTCAPNLVGNDVRVGSIGHARITIGRRTVSSRVVRWFAETFRVRLVD